jgi:hypothetical protein
LPNDLLSIILEKLPFEEGFVWSLACKRWHSIVQKQREICEVPARVLGYYANNGYFSAFF